MLPDLQHTVRPGQLYFVTFPKLPGTFDSSERPWHRASVFTLRANGEASEGPWILGNIPLGSTALVLREPGEGLSEVARAYNLEPTRFVRCLVTPEGEGCPFEAIVGITELWRVDPRTSPVPTVRENG